MTTPKLTVLLALATLACHESLSPADYTGTYELRTVNATPVPTSAPGAPAGCTVGFQSATLTLATGVFSLGCTVSFGCPGYATAVATWDNLGGAVESAGGAANLRVIDPMSGTAVNWTLRVAGSDAIVTIPSGSLTLAAPTTLVFGPRQPLASGAPVDR